MLSHNVKRKFLVIVCGFADMKCVLKIKPYWKRITTTAREECPNMYCNFMGSLVYNRYLITLPNDNFGNY